MDIYINFDLTTEAALLFVRLPCINCYGGCVILYVTIFTGLLEVRCHGRKQLFHIVGGFGTCFHEGNAVSICKVLKIHKMKGILPLYYPVQTFYHILETCIFHVRFLYLIFDYFFYYNMRQRSCRGFSSLRLIQNTGRLTKKKQCLTLASA